MPLARLTHMGYCGTPSLPVLGELEELRHLAAHRLRRYRRNGFPIRTRNLGFEWEIEEPEGASMVPDECGTLRIRLICEDCEQPDVYEGETICAACADRRDEAEAMNPFPDEPGDYDLPEDEAHGCDPHSEF